MVTMGRSLSVIFSDIFSYCQTESEVVNPSKSKCQKGFDDDINRRYKDQPDKLFEKLNNNHPKINYTTETQSGKFLDTK